jgi:TPR repeat protein
VDRATTGSSGGARRNSPLVASDARRASIFVPITELDYPTVFFLRASNVRRIYKKRNVSKTALARAFLEAGCILYEAKERELSVQLLLKSAVLGNIEAQSNIGSMYDNGDGLPLNFVKSRYWYKRAIRGGSAVAAYNLGISYRNRGKFRLAEYWLIKAMEMGDSDAADEIPHVKELETMAE